MSLYVIVFVAGWLCGMFFQVLLDGTIWTDNDYCEGCPIRQEETYR